ncbi:hypothetical protein AM493_01635 [Flavobacterium akiainvivens]|uniref:Uncharacterized protein n=1 Tax=Flavobacterium akiainvivens TaxID=1202724 RepID=A0A0M9VGV2_9FLAO|nr:hypothetical protein [Flavobacterium akiainvivens]KOS04886.1 hypothetical protein AM493_01635 [Flavobacterium akiainvivens]SFQ42742.1 hypothetical protein SAMN05444144_104196 [Flavobacterium akiainvivens]
MDNHCFVVLELPGGEELKYVDEANTHGFWTAVAGNIRDGKAKIISKRQDTGISEDLRSHVSGNQKFTTYVLVDMHLHPQRCSNNRIFERVSAWLTGTGRHRVIDDGANFQLVTID